MYDSAETTEEMYIKVFGFVKSIGMAGLSSHIAECSMTILQHAKFCKQKNQKKKRKAKWNRNSPFFKTDIAAHWKHFSIAENCHHEYSCFKSCCEIGTIRLNG